MNCKRKWNNLKKVRKQLEYDPLLLPPFAVKEEIERQIPEISEVLSPTPIVPQLLGLRIKLPYIQFRDQIADVKLGDYCLKEIAEIQPSNFRDYIIVKFLKKSQIQKQE